MTFGLTAAVAWLSLAAPNPDLALVNARIEIGDGTRIERGFVTIREGKILQVGPGAFTDTAQDVVDLRGLTIYPGFIDGATTDALRLPALPQGTPRPNTDTAPATMMDSVPRLVRPELRAEEHLEATESTLKERQRTGFLFGHVVPSSGLFRGSTAVIRYGTGDLKQQVVRAGLGQSLAPTFAAGGPGGGGGGGQGGAGYPGSLLGAYATIRQTLIDAEAYQGTSNGEGVNATLAALRPVLNGEVPVIFRTNSVQDFVRAQNLADEFGLRVIPIGARDAARALTHVKAMPPVLINLAFGTEPDLSEKALADQEANFVPAGVIRARHEAWLERAMTPIFLAKAGVPFGFTTESATPSEVRKNLKRLVDWGLDPRDVVRALTSAPAEILGIADLVGTVRPGLFADFVIVDGNIWNPDAKISGIVLQGTYQAFEEEK